MSKTVTVKGREWSEDTIELALQEYVKSHPESYQFQAGDVIVCDGGDKEKRIILNTEEGKLISIDRQGNFMSKGQEEFEIWDYRKIGVISDFIK
jgi:hypothetical protein